MTTVCVIGATGSIGRATLDICSLFPEKFRINWLWAHHNSDRLLEEATRLKVPRIGLFDVGIAKKAREDLALRNPSLDFPIEILEGPEGLLEAVNDPDTELYVFASSGTDSIPALQVCLQCGKKVALANKESLVVAGPWVMPLQRFSGQIRPIDSEHSALWQCLWGESPSEVEKVFLTASGGPFRDFSLEALSTVTPEMALKHPTWQMGQKVTIDSATLMNKGIECIEASQLFGLELDRIEAVIHPSSQIHGIVEFGDGTFKLLLSTPDMRIPTALALSYPERLPLALKGIPPLPMRDWVLSPLFPPDLKRFPCLGIALEAGRKGGAYPPILVAADEVAVSAFLERKISFMQIAQIVERTLEAYSGPSPSCLDEALGLIEWGKRIARELSHQLGGWE